MDVPLTFNGREYRLSVEELDRLAESLEARAERRHPAGIGYGHVEDETFGALAARVRAAIEPPLSAIELQGHEAAAVVLALIDSSSPELDRFFRDYAAENPWTQKPFSSVIAPTLGVCFALKIGQWFFEEGLQTPIGGIDEETGEDLWPREPDFAAHAAANAAFAEVASTWARLRGSVLADERVIANDTLAWLRGERERALVASADDGSNPVDRAAATSRAWALWEAALWLESCANRARLPWDSPRHQA